MLEHGTPAQREIAERMVVELGYAIENNKTCHKVLRNTFGLSRCVFRDMLELRAGRSGIRRFAHCMTHGRPCPVPNTDAGAHEVGPSSAVRRPSPCTCPACELMGRDSSESVRVPHRLYFLSTC